MSRLLAEALAVTAKDLRTEFRTRVALNALGLFALTVLAAVSYTVGPYRITAEDRPFLLAVLLWIVIFFAALAGLDRSFVKEEESREVQKEIFRFFVKASLELDLPLNVHSRSAGRAVIDFLTTHGALKVQLHAFDGRAGSALPGVEAGFLFSIPPSVVRSRQ